MPRNVYTYTPCNGREDDQGDYEGGADSVPLGRLGQMAKLPQLLG